MFITDQFVFLHIPKTAGTFVHKVLRELYCPSPLLRKLHSLRRVTGVSVPFLPYHYREVVKHTIRRRIPEACDGSRPVLLAVRNPLDHYVSTYRFDWWRKFAHRWYRDVSACEREFGPVGSMDFDQFISSSIQFARWAEGPVTGRRALGPSSAEWLRYFCSVPSRAVEQQSESELIAEVKAQMRDVNVLRMESLNQELKCFLLAAGLPQQRLEFLDQAKRVYPGKVTRNPDDAWANYYSPELIRKIVDAEWMIFKMFPQYLDRVSEMA